MCCLGPAQDLQPAIVPAQAVDAGVGDGASACAVEGLAVPASPSALRLPERPASEVAFGNKDAKGDGVCLDQPPKMPAPERGVEVEGTGGAEKEKPST